MYYLTPRYYKLMQLVFGLIPHICSWTKSESHERNARKWNIKKTITFNIIPNDKQLQQAPEINLLAGLTKCGVLWNVI